MMTQTQEQPSEQYPGAVLLSDHIKEFVDRGELIVRDPWYGDLGDTFDEKQLDRAKYNVRLGRTYFKAGEFRCLDEGGNTTFKVEPYELVFVESYEVFKMPPNVVARYDLRISKCLAGLGLQTGLQLDPTYHGRFFCPIFNFSDKPEWLTYKDQLASLQFNYTTPPTQKTKPYGGKPGLFCLTQALSSPRGTGLDALRRELEHFHEASDRLHSRVDTMVNVVYGGMTFILATLGVTVAALSFLVVNLVKPQPESIFEVKPLALGIGIAILLIILFGGSVLILILMKRMEKRIMGEEDGGEKRRGK
ncbi:MAG: hypothetical protein WB564_01810 [Dehalococcoidia bacterium]